MRSFFLFFFVISISHSLWALSDEDLVQSCWVPAKEKLFEKAQRQDCEIQLDKMRVKAIDNRWYNPSKYVWFACSAICEDGTTNMEVLLQYYRDQCQ